MPTDLHKRVVFNDGEGLTHGDLNDTQTYLEARLYDQILEGLVGNVSLTATDPEMNGQRGANAPTHLAYTLHGGSAYLRQGSGNNKLQIAPGVLMQKIANTTGDTPTFLAYRFDGTDEVTIANGGVNWRIDLVQMKLELVDADTQVRDFEDGTTGAKTSVSMTKKKRVQCTLSVKQGTPAASPQYPDPDAGYVAVAGVVVGATYAAAGGFFFGTETSTTSVAVVHDQRMPINCQSYHTDMITAYSVAAWTVTAGTAVASSSNVVNDIRIPCPKSGASRVVGVTISHSDAGTVAGVSLVKQLGASSFAQRFALTNLAAGPVKVFVPYYTFEGQHNTSGTGPTILQSATNKIGVPLWSDGSSCARLTSQLDASISEHVYPLKAAVRIQSGSATTVVNGVTWHLAQGI